MRHFWNWVKNDDETRTLYLEGGIAEESWFSDDITPAMFKEELFSGNGPITLHINSPGGDCIAASQIYTMLMDYPGDVTVQIDGMAASAASVIAMAGTKVCMSPTSMMMIHNPFTMAMGDTEEMRKAIQLLDEVNALKAKELGFCDEVLYTGELDLPDNTAGFSFGRRAAAACLMNRVLASIPKAVLAEPKEPEHPPDTAPTPDPVPDNRVKAADLEKRLSLLK